MSLVGSVGGVYEADGVVSRASGRDTVPVFGAVASPDDAPRRALHLVGLAPWLDHLPAGLDEVIDGDTDLSAGEAQLLAFARDSGVNVYAGAHRVRP